MQLGEGMWVRRVPKLLFYIQALPFRQFYFEDAPQKGMTITINDDEITYLTAAQWFP